MGEFVDGPALDSDLIAWFEGEGSGKWVRIPIVVVPQVLGLSSGTLGSVKLSLDDTGMSVSLADRVRDDCPYDEPCTIWVEGFWGSTGPSFGGMGMPGEPEHTFSTRKYVGKVEGTPTHIKVKTGDD
jgi:hypothetical protein